MLAALLLPLALAASGPSHTRMIVEDPALLTSSSGTNVLQATLGNQLDYKLFAQPQGLAFVAFSTTPPLAPSAIGGVPVAVDLSNFGFALEAAPFDANGQLVWSTFVPDNLVAGTSIWTQSAAFDPTTGQIHLANGVRLDIVPPIPANLPLLPAGQHVGVDYYAPLPAAQPVLDLAFVESLVHGADTTSLRISWSDIEVSPGKYSTAAIEAQLQQNVATGQRTLLILETVNGNLLEIPSDLVDPLHPDQLAPGMTWDSFNVASRFMILLDVVSPLLVANDGYFLSVGHEVDQYLAANPSELTAFANFVDTARTHVHATQPKLALGVTMTTAGALAAGGTLAAMQAASDNVAFTYFPLMADGTAEDPMVPSMDLPALTALVAPYPLILAEVGYGSGFDPMPLGGSTQAKQATFTKSLFETLSTLPKARVAIWGHLADLTAPELVELGLQSGNNDPDFLENRGTIGLRSAIDGAAKPSWTEYLLGLDSL